MKKNLTIILFYILFVYNGFAQNIPFNVFTTDHKYKEVLYRTQILGKFYYYNEENPPGATFGSMEHSRTVIREIDFSSNKIQVTETNKNDTDTAWHEMKPAFLFPGANKWQEISGTRQGAYKADFSLKPGELNAKKIISDLFGLIPKGKISISSETKTYQSGTEVNPKTYSTEAVKFYFETDYFFTATDKKNPYKLTAQHWIWLSKDIPGGLLERIDQVVFNEIVSTKDYTVSCHYLIERVGTHEELYAESVNENNESELRSMLTEKLTYLEKLRKKSKKDYINYVDTLLWEIAEALDQVKNNYTDLYDSLKKVYPLEIAYFEENIADKISGDTADSLLDAFGMDQGEDYDEDY